MSEPAATWRLYGLTLASDLPFTTVLVPAAGRPDLVLRRSRELAPLASGDSPPPVFSSVHARQGESVAHLYRLGGREVLRFDELVEFVLRDRRVDWRLADSAYEFLVELRFLGPVLAYWLESRGVPALHAAAVAAGGRAVAFLASGHSGKTTLAAACLAAGDALLSDDLAALDEREGRFVVRPGVPEMRMWPATAARFGLDAGGLQLVHPRFGKRRVPVGAGGFGRFQTEPLPLAGIYLPHRRAAGDPDSGVEIAPLSRRQALIELVRGTYGPHIVEAVGLQPGRLERFARLLAAVPVKRLDYPSGHRHLPAVRRALLADLDRS